MEDAHIDERTGGQATLVLCVEDDDVLRRGIMDIAELAGFTAIGASNGQEGIDLALRMSPSVILMDIMMPVMDGYEAFERLKAHPDTRRIPIIFLSARGQHSDIRRGLAMGAAAYLPKPFEWDNLLTCVRDVLRGIRLGIYDEG